MVLTVVRRRLEKTKLRHMSVLISLRPPVLLQVVEGLLRRSSTFQAFERSGATELVARARRLRPALIVASFELSGKFSLQTIRELKRVSPGSRLLLLGFLEGLGEGIRENGADGYLEVGALTGQLVPTVRRLVRRAPVRPRADVSGSRLRRKHPPVRRYHTDRLIPLSRSRNV